MTTDQKYQQIRELLDRGVTQQKIAEHFKIAQSLVSKIKHGFEPVPKQPKVTKVILEKLSIPERLLIVILRARGEFEHPLHQLHVTRFVDEVWAANPRLFKQWSIENGYADRKILTLIDPSGGIDATNVYWRKPSTRLKITESELKGYEHISLVTERDKAVMHRLFEQGFTNIRIAAKYCVSSSYIAKIRTKQPQVINTPKEDAIPNGELDDILAGITTT
jgi:transcriptional regulator with XRE-family HTH domain